MPTTQVFQAGVTASLFVPTVLFIVSSYAAEVSLTLNRASWTLQTKLWLRRSFYIGPLISVCWSILSLSLRNGNNTWASPQCGLENMNPDIAGVGIRIALYVPQILTMLNLALGHYHTELVGLKELCQLQILGLVMLTGLPIITRTSLHLSELVMVCLSIDGLNAALSMTLSSKDVLSVPWLVRTVIAVQTASLLLLVTMFARMQLWIQASGAGTDCFMSIWWWSSFNASNAATAPSFWMYLIYRSCQTSHAAWLALRLHPTLLLARKTFATYHFDQSCLSNSTRTMSPESTDLEAHGAGVELQHYSNTTRHAPAGVDCHAVREGLLIKVHSGPPDQVYGLDVLRTSICSKHFDFWATLLSTMVLTEVTLRDLRLGYTANWIMWGQLVALSLCLKTILQCFAAWAKSMSGQAVRRRWLAEKLTRRIVTAVDPSWATPFRKPYLSSADMRHDIFKYVFALCSFPFERAIRNHPLVRLSNMLPIDHFRTLSDSRSDFNMWLRVATIQAPVEYGFLLHDMVRNNDINGIRDLLAREVDTEILGEYGLTPLALAAKNIQADIVECLLLSGKVEVDEGGECSLPGVNSQPLYQACMSTSGSRLDRARVVRSLLQHGANPQFHRELEFTAVELALKRGQTSVLQLMLDFIPFTKRQMTRFYRTRMYCLIEDAVAFNRLSILRLLLRCKKIDVSSPHMVGRALCWAVVMDFRDMYSELLSHPDIDPNIEDAEHGGPMLAYAVRKSNLELCEQLLAHPKIDPNRRNNAGGTALMESTTSSEEVCRRLLSDDRVDVNAVDDNGQTALMHAVQWASAGVIDAFTSCTSLGLNVRDARGRTALMHAARFDNVEFCEKLLARAGLDVNATDDSGQTCLHHAVEKAWRDTQLPVPPSANGSNENAYKIVCMLLSDGRIERDAKDSFGRSAARIAEIESDDTLRRLRSASSEVESDLLEENRYRYTSMVVMLKGRQAAGTVEAESLDQYQKRRTILRQAHPTCKVRLTGQTTQNDWSYMAMMNCPPQRIINSAAVHSIAEGRDYNRRSRLAVRRPLQRPR